METRLANTALSIFAAVVVAVLVYLFYASPLREHAENKMYDIRTRMAPMAASHPDVAVIEITDESIRSLEQPDPAHAAAQTAKAPKDISPATLLRILKGVQTTQARAIGLVLLPQVFPYTAPEMEQIAAAVAADPRVYLGTFDLSLTGKTEAAVPAAFQPIRDRIAKADIVRDFRREIIRSLEVARIGELPYLTFKLAGMATTPSLPDAVVSDKGTITSIRLKYGNPDRLHVVAAHDMLKNPANAGLDGRIVLIGYAAYRPYTVYEREATHVNTPWQADGEDFRYGMPVARLLAIGTSNLIRGNWMVTPPLWVNIIQTTVIAVLSFLIWRFSVGFASLLFLGGWAFYLIIQASIFSSTIAHVPLADALLWSSLCTFTGALGRLRLEGKLRAEQEAKFSAEREVSTAQDKFLNRFTLELSQLNQGVRSTLASIEPAAALAAGPSAADGKAAARTRDTWIRAMGSCEELADYLAGIQQFAALREKQLKKPKLTPVEVLPVARAVMRHFESRISDAGLTLNLEGREGVTAIGDRTLLAQIIYNLVSNAVKYSPPGGRITIGVTAANGSVQIAVQDEGPGIAPEFHERIFEKFYRVKDELVYKVKGHGLGLYLSRYFADRIQAGLRVDSEPGKGARFTLTLRGGKA